MNILNILALETSGAEAGIAALQSEVPGEAWDGLSAPARALAVLGSAEPRQLSRGIITGIDAALHRAGWTLDDVNALAVGLGPGSWTSLRIGLSTAKTLAQARGWRLAGVPTFDAMAQAVWRFARTQREGGAQDERASLQGQNGSLVDAASRILHPSVPLPEHFVLLAAARCRPGEAYGKVFECRPNATTALQPEQVGAPLALADVAAQTLASMRGGSMRGGRRGEDTSLVLVGDGAGAVSDELTRRGTMHLALSLPIEVLAMEVGRAGEVMLRAGQDSDPLALQPLYVAPSAAERRLQREP